MVKANIAENDIECFKYIMIDYYKNYKYCNGEHFTGNINNITCEGKIRIEDNVIYFCTNDSRLRGNNCNNKHGYEYSWQADRFVYHIAVNSKKEKNIYRTVYRNFCVVIGKTYKSKLEKVGNKIEKGLHSYAEIPGKSFNEKIVKCIIPKGSKYYTGTFNDKVSYASDKLKYIEIIS